MDQTKFINSYINNLAEQLKASTLDNIMLKTQLTLANETVAELTTKIQELEEALKLASTTPTSKKAAKSDWEEGSFKPDE
jgi:predicted nuclease with TOPRIM domain